ncbi:MAG: flavodoxin domain-containing protein [Candidatus Ancaeobacter aquaticus]|nr:flavodoxin domain-containing protein [Candidatus Ancaeobacter aquaticus]
MSKVLVCYYSRTGNTEKMAAAIGGFIKDEGVDVDVKKVQDVKANELEQYDGIVVGSPTYYGTMAWEIKKLLDESVVLHGKLKGKVGGAFSSAANIAGGNETTILDIINAFLIHGMIVQGEPKGDHYGPVAIGSPDQRTIDCCKKHAINIATLIKKL